MANNISIMEALRRVSKTAQEYALKNTPHIISEEVLLTIPASSINKDDYNTAISAGNTYYISITDTVPTSFNEDDEYFIKYNNVEYPCGNSFETFDSNFKARLVLEQARPTSLDSNSGISVQIMSTPDVPYIAIETMDTTNITDIQLISKQVQRLDNMFLQKDLKLGNSLSIGRTGDIGHYSSAIGLSTEATGYGSHAEGCTTKATEDFAHAEGYGTIASGMNSHAEGSETKAIGMDSHAEGSITTAEGSSSHVEGSNTATSTSAFAAHAEGYFTKASSNYQHVQGRYNIEDAENKFAHIVGNGANDSTTNWKEVRSNAHTLDWKGNAWYAGDVQANNVPYIASETVVLTVPAATITANKESIDNSHANGRTPIQIDGTFTYDETKNYFVKYNGKEYPAFYESQGLIVANTDCGCAFMQATDTTIGVAILNLDTENITDLQLISRDINKLKNLYLNENILIGNSLTVGFRVGYTGLNSSTNGFMNEASGENSHAEGWYTNAIGFNSHIEGQSDSRFIDVVKLTADTLSGGSSGGQSPQSVVVDDASVTTLSMNEIATKTEPAVSNGNIDYFWAYFDSNKTNVSTQSVTIEPNERFSKDNIINMWKLIQFAMAYGDLSHVEGYNSLGLGDCSHVSGSQAIAYGDGAYAHGSDVIAYGEGSHVEGFSSINLIGLLSNNSIEAPSSVEDDVAVQDNTVTNISLENLTKDGLSSLFGGFDFSIAYGEYSHVEGSDNLALGNSSHAEGASNEAYGDWSHAEGYATLANGNASHAEGFCTIASTDYSHAEGCDTLANGNASHAEGYKTIASADYSHAEGEGTEATVQSQHVEGKWNLPVENAAHIVGNGKGNTDRGNAYVLDWDGNAHFDGKVKQNGVPTDDNDLATKKYVDENSSKVADGFIMNDQEQDGYRYLIQMKSGVLTSTLLPSSITVDTASLEGVTFMDGDAIDVETLTFMAQYPDGSTSTITDTENLSYEPADLTTDVTQVSFVYNIAGLKLTYDMPITVTAFDPAVKLQDFEYTTNSDGTYTLTGWKETYNGVASTELIIPNNKRIIL